MITYKPKRKFRSVFASVAMGLVIFTAGYGFGTGAIGFGSFFQRQPATNQHLPENLDYSAVDQVYKSLKDNFAGELELSELINGLKHGLVRATGDPYTEFLDEEEVAAFEEGLTGTFTGIGAELSKEDNFIVVVAPIAGFPAEKAGLRAQDIITRIDDEPAYDLSINEAVRKIRGPKDTTVKLTVVRNGSQELNIEITRAEIIIPSVESEILDGQIGYLKISRFGDDTFDLSRRAANEFKSAGVKGIVLDMRNNPGGLLDASVELSSLWLNQNDVVLEERRDDVVVRTYRTNHSPILRGIPTVVLVNEGSASASEITAGALRDHGLAKVFGAQTFGKGSVQKLIDFRDGTQLKVTVARWFTPKGKNIDQEGVKPDKEVRLTNEDLDANKDPQLDAALDSLR
jgi:carboxyl-terminal processing protease